MLFTAKRDITKLSKKPKNMNKKIGKNYLFNLIYQIITILYPLIVTPYVARIFQPEGVGQYSFSVTIVTYFTLIFTCIGKYGFREISIKEKVDEKSSLFFEILVIKLALVGVLFPIYFFAFCRNGDLRVLYLIQSITFLNGIFDIGWYLQGSDNFIVPAIVNAVSKVLTIICVFVFVKSQSDLPIYAGIVSAWVLFASICLWFTLRGRICRPSKINIRRHIVPCLLLVLPYFITELYSSFDKTMIKLITQNDAELGYYEETLKVARIVMVVITSLSQVKAPTHSKYFFEGDNISLKKSMSESGTFIIFLGLPMVMGICVVATEFVPIFFGSGYEKVIVLLYLYAPFVLIHSFVDLFSNQYLIPCKKQNVFTFSLLAASILNIGLNFLLVSNYKSIGAVIATLSSEFALCIFLFIYCHSVISIKQLMLQSWKYLVASFVMFCFAYIPFCFFSFSNLYIDFLIKFFVGVFVYFLMLFILRDKLFYGIIRRIVKHGKNS